MSEKLFEPCPRCWDKQGVWAMNKELCEYCMDDLRREHYAWLNHCLSLDPYCLHWTTKSLIDVENKKKELREGHELISKWKKRKKS
jgi:hypothetical protein